jgi:hypothetical protein
MGGRTLEKSQYGPGRGVHGGRILGGRGSNVNQKAVTRVTIRREGMSA